MARLHVLQPDTQLLYRQAMAYSTYETACELIGMPCDTSEFDDQLIDIAGGGADILITMVERLTGNTTNAQQPHENEPK
jgi:hypothetical protein